MAFKIDIENNFYKHLFDYCALFSAPGLKRTITIVFSYKKLNKNCSTQDALLKMFEDLLNASKKDSISIYQYDDITKKLFKFTNCVLRSYTKNIGYIKAVFGFTGWQRFINAESLFKSL